MPGTIVATKELARTFENEVGSAGGVAKRRWVCMLSDDTLINSNGPPDMATILTATAGTSWGAYHPVHTLLRLRKVSVTERFEDNPYALEVTGEYGLVTADELLTPTARAARWSFESKPGQVPALFYYDGTSQLPLTNSAYDYFPGLVTEESLVQIKVQKNFAAYPSLWLGLQNYVNNATYLGCPIDTVKVVGVDVQYETEEFGNALVNYWAATATLAYRQSSHRLLVPDIGFNFLDGGQKRRAMVFDFQNAEWVASPNPVGLNNSGAQTGGAPAIRSAPANETGLRVNPRGDFATAFGTPPAPPP
jgi:hypothetical protein